MNESFREAVIKVYGKNEVDENTGRSTHHIHQLRKFFISQLSISVGRDIANFFAGHVSPLTKTYQQLGKKQMSEYYLKGEYSLFIEAPAELRKIPTTTKKEIDVIKDDTIKNHSVMLSLMNEISQLKRHREGNA